jgi:NAD(P)-dependent dehydrogenase (short-subunit alcohol dehydrogenase family)
MDISQRVVVVTGAASGIGAALVRRFLAEGARAVVAVDLINSVTPDGSVARCCDVADERAVASLVADIEREHGRIDLFCSNAGVLSFGWDLRRLDLARWDHDWRVNVMAHAYAAKAVLPGMIARGEGYLLQTLSAAALLASPESASYTTTKHAALGLAEFLAFSYRRYGIRVSALCPMAVSTPMVDAIGGDGASAGLDGVITPDEVADTAIAGIRDERFLIFPHPRVPSYAMRKAEQPEKWLKKMASLQERYTDVGQV